MSRVFTVIGFWGNAGEREVVGVIEGVHDVLGGDSTRNYGSGPFAVYVSAVDHDSAAAQVQGTVEGDELGEVFADG